MATLQSLPFHIQILIIRKLDLADALTYAQVHPVFHNAVYYVFAHRLELDFSSTLNSNDVISLSDETIMKVLHAHTRTTQIRNLSLSINFKALDQLKFYLDLYWNQTFIPYYDPSPTLRSGRYVGHPSGKLTLIGYISSNAPTNHQLLELLHSYDDPVYGVRIDSEPLFTPMLPDDMNWSNVDVDEQYAKCIQCEVVKAYSIYIYMYM